MGRAVADRRRRARPGRADAEPAQNRHPDPGRYAGTARSPADRGRPRASARERRPLLAGRIADHGDDAGGGRRTGPRRPRSRAGYLGSGSPTAVRAVLSRRAGSRRVRHRHGAVDRARPARGRARAHLGRKRPRRRRAIHHRRSGRAEGSGGRSGRRAAGMNTAARILLVDDEVPIQRAVAPLLRSRGYDVEVAGTGQEALRMVAAHPPDLIVLDLGLPDIEGTEVCRRVRESWPMPIIILSARGREADKVTALDLGADDYVTKPFGPEELLARIRVWLRRLLPDERVESGRVTIGDLVVDYDRRRALRGAEEIRLTPEEFELLAFMARNPDRVMTHRAILKAVWGPNAADQPEHLWVLVAQLRKKIEVDPAAPRYLVSEPWVGYRLATEGPSRSE